MPPPIPTRIFHITAIDNLASIAASGEILSKHQLVARGITATSIAYQQIQHRRSTRVVPIAPGGTLHDYVPFHFAPRSPMLKTIDEGNVPGCDLRQDDIVHLLSTAQAIAQANLPFVFTDIHAVLQMATFVDDLGQLGMIDWDIFFEQPCLAGFCKYWFNRPNPRHLTRMETRQAEFLVRDSVPLAVITQIGVRTENMAARVRAGLANTDWRPNISVIPGWYF